MSETPKERREAAKIRRRWISLGEAVAVAAVLISAATLWNSYAERRSAEADRAATAQKEGKVEAALVLRARPVDDGKRLTIEAVDPDQVIQSQRLILPSKLDVTPIETAGDARIEARWLADALKESDAKRTAAGDLRVPVAIVSRFTSKGEMHDAAAVYQLAYVREGHLLGGSSIRLRGLSLVGRVPEAQAKKAVDGAFRR
ncbi:hypothetical protein GON01_10130 [Sphingomonas sp. MAH-20]|uniref:Uncharacterized protein n=1 Tax=Sphingomonas horti TaxID=2682842 RepID=A0A6I4J130_9SPHN|nr:MULTISPECIES: hypothetical protein [Sphingomonas]MBA2919409.1 hypothetical protein [Sphingomonas sp. CGMCC 1.13658]MVO78290.1 hypothetical protein [Sphingomonas horti]